MNGLLASLAVKRLIWDLRRPLWLLVNAEHTFIWGHFCLERGLMAMSLMGVWGLPQYLQRVWGTQEQLCDERLYQATELAPPPPPGQAAQPRHHEEETRLEWCETTGCIPLPVSWHVSGQSTTRQCRLATPVPSGIESCWGNSYLLRVLVPFFAGWQFKCDNCKIVSLGEETLNCLWVLQSRPKRNKTQCAKTSDQH